MNVLIQYQLINIVIVLNASVVVENSCQSLPFEISLSASIDDSVSFCNIFPLRSAILIMMSSASFLLPFRSSHLGDSGIILKTQV